MNRHAAIRSFKIALQSIGYESRQIADSYPFADFKDSCAVVNRISLAAFSGYPCTYRNACIGVVFSSDKQNGDDGIHRYRALGAPIIFEVGERTFQTWRVGANEVQPVGSPFALNSLDAVFHSNHSSWNPETLGRLKLASDAKSNSQLDFYDVGLLPVLERFFQRKLKDLLAAAFANATECYRSLYGKEPAVAFLFPYLFRFVTAKVFMDRADAQGWDGLDTPRKILDKAERHSGSGLLEKLPKEFLDRRMLERTWESISATLHFQNLSIPDLVSIYEDLFIDDNTRQKLGVHSTPVGLASYIVNNLPWHNVPVNERIILEGFCGHGIFLAQAMERLSQDLSPNLTPRQRHQYFQKMLIGVEKDPLAIEVCRLLLTLSDYPNDNSWQLHHNDVFDWSGWNTVIKSASVVLANPPYEPFSKDERQRLKATKAQPPAEFIHRLLRHPPAMLGLVLPQSFLSSPCYKFANREIAQRYADVSIVELPKLFKYADNETVAVMASGRRDLAEKVSVHYAEVLPAGVERFFLDSKVSTTRNAELIVPTTKQGFTLWIPQKGSVFDSIPSATTLGQIAKIRQGLHWVPRTDGKPRTAPRTDVVSDFPRKGFSIGAEKMAGNLTQFQLKTLRYLSTLPEHHHPRDKAWRNPWDKPKVVCNTGRFERKSPWRLAAWADTDGLAFSKVYFAMWPQSGVSEFALAAILSSPLANAFCYERDLDRSNRIVTLEKIPMPPVDCLTETGQLHLQCKRLQQLLSNTDLSLDSNRKEIVQAVIRLDAEVLAVYNISASVQRQLLDSFQGWKRPLSEEFESYFPEHFRDSITLKDFIAIQYDWDEINEQRCNLIEKELTNGGLNQAEISELDRLQCLADSLIRLKDPYPLEELGNLVKELKAKGKWKPSI